MSNLKIQQIREVILSHLYFMAVNDISGGSLFSKQWNRTRPLPISLYLFDRICDSASDEGLVSIITSTGGGKYYSLSLEGMAHVEQFFDDPDHVVHQMIAETYNLPQRLPQQRYAGSPFTPVAWKKPDEAGEKTVDQQAAIVAKLEALAERIDGLDMDNADKEQAAARVKSALTLAHAPVPPWQMVVEILQPLSAIATIAALVIEIVRMVTT